MKKLDLILSAVIGFLNGIFFYFILKQVGVTFGFLPFLIIVFPILAVIGMLITSFLGKKFLFILQAAKFFLVGTLNTFIDLVVLNILILLTQISSGVFYSLFKTISFLGATTNSYFWNRFWTFEKRGEENKPKEFAKFFIITIIGLLINVAVASFVVNKIGPQFGITQKLWASIGAIVAAFFAFLWNFIASKFIVFKK